MSINEIIDKYCCHDSHAEYCNDDCEYCEKQLSDDMKEFLAEHDKQIRDSVIDELTQEVEFEEKWLFDCYKEMGCRYTRRDVDIAFSGIKQFLNKLKGE